MEIKSIPAVYLLLFVLSTSAFEYDEQCNATITVPPQCDPTAFLICTTEYEGDTIGKCLCPEDSHWEPLEEGGKATCKKNAAATCTDGVGQMKCALNAKCDANRICSCDPGFIPSKEKDPSHYLKICVGSNDTSCGPYPELPGSRKRCDIINGLNCDVDLKCTCDTNKLWSTSRQKCLTKVQNYCLNDDDCVENAGCSQSSACTCGTGFSSGEDKTCYVSHGNPCVGTTGSTSCNALELTQCTNGNCECPAGTRYKDGKCKKLLREDCIEDSDCYAGFCHLSNKCLCLSNQLELSNNTCVTMSGDNGGFCRGNADCLGKNFLSCNLTATVETEYGLCECDGEMVYQNGECRVKADENCSKNGNCVINAACLKEKCECSENSAMTWNKFCHVKESQPCSPISNPCSHELGLICKSNNVCGCPDGQIWEYSETAKALRCVALVSGNCTESASFCTRNAVCTKAGICECVQGFSATPIDSTLKQPRRCLRAHDEPCNENDFLDYTQSCNPYDFLSCSANGKCECKLPTQQIYDSEVGKCLSKSGGFCGKLEENDINQTCAKYSTCLPDLEGIFRCACDQRGIAVGEVCPSGEENKGVKTFGISSVLLLLVSLSYFVIQT